MTIWWFRTRRYIVLFASREMRSCATVHARSDGRILGKAVDLVGMKTRQQLVREACDNVLPTLIRELLERRAGSR